MTRGRPKKTNKVTNIKDKQKEKALADFEGNFAKIRIDKKTDIPELHYYVRGQFSDDTVIKKGQSKPLDSFLKSMQALSRVFCEICEMEDKLDECVITTVNFSQKGGVIISGQVNLTEHDIPQPLCLNTPHILIENESGGYELPDYAKEQIEELKRQAVMYMRGEVAEKQTNLFDEAAEA